MTASERIIIQLLIGVSLIACGCLPMRSQEVGVTGGQKHDRFDLYGDYGPQRCDTIAIVQLGPSNTPKTGTIIDAESYAIAPGGKRVGISTAPYAFDIGRNDPRVPNIRDALFLTAADGRRDGSAWKDGDWKFVLSLDTPAGRQTRELDVSLKSKVDVWWIWQAPN